MSPERAPRSAGQSDPAGQVDPATDGKVDLGRRTFFRTIGRNAVTAAGQVAGAADALRRGSAAAAEELFHLGTDDAASSADRLAAGSASPAADVTRSPARPRTPLSARIPLGAASPGETPTHRSSYRLDGDLLYLLDQRLLPGRTDEVTIREGRDLARAIRTGVVRGGPLLGQLAAYGIALTASRHRDRRPGAQRVEISAADGLLRGTRPSARPMVTALDRMKRRRESLGTDPASDVLADAMRAEADTIAIEAMHDHAALARHGAAVLSPSAGGPYTVLLHGSVGALGNGMVGTGLGIVRLIAAQGIPVHVWLTTGMPTMEGSRASAWELSQAGLPHTVLPDPAVAWLFANERLDAVVLGADWLAANGDAAVLTGAAAMAIIAAAGPTEHAAAPDERPDRRPTVMLCAPLSCLDPTAASGLAMPPDRRSRQEITSDLAATWGATSVGPAVDLVKAGWLDSIVTEEGDFVPNDPLALLGALRARDERRDPAVRMAI
ncbi:MAG: hypothetical protein ACR2LP_01755 [Candidatus Limnocylindrales bacterium]